MFKYLIRDDDLFLQNALDPTQRQARLQEFQGARSNIFLVAALLCVGMVAMAVGILGHILLRSSFDGADGGIGLRGLLTATSCF